MIVRPVVQSSWMAFQGITNAADNGGDSATHTSTTSDNMLFGIVRSQHHQSFSTALHAVPQSSATQLSYKNTDTDEYMNDVDMEEAVSSATVFSTLVEDDNGMEMIETAPDQPSVMSILKHFQVIAQAGRVTYPHLLDTVSTWGRKKHIRRRLKFIEMLTPVQTDSLESLFRLVDRDEDDLIDAVDFRAVLDSVKPEEEDAIDEEPPKLGLNGFKKMTSDEFVGIAAEAEFYDLLAVTFGGMDTEGNGYVRVDDVAELLHGLKSICTSFDCNAKLNEFINDKSEPEDGKKHRYVYYRDLITSLLDMEC